MRVFVYWNILKKNYSVRSLVAGASYGRVISRESTVLLRGCHFRVHEAGRQRVLREKQKSVHAGIVGMWDRTADVDAVGGVRVRYNPYRSAKFQIGDQAIEAADVVLCTTTKERTAHVIAIGVD